jgi:hypothetical protein
MKAIFKNKSHKDRSGSLVTVLSLLDLDEDTFDLVGHMWTIRFADGFEMQAFDNELTFRSI